MESTKIDNISITYFGNSAFLLESEGVRLYLDPVGIPQDVIMENKADMVLVSHADEKNTSSDDIQKILKEGTGVFGPQKVEDSIGPKVRVVAEGDSFEHAGIHVVVVPAYTEGSSFHPRGDGFGYEIQFGGKKIYFAGDTDLIPSMSDRKNIDIAFLPIEGISTMDYEDATEAVRIIKPQYAIPMHFIGDIDNPADNFRLASETHTNVIVLHGENGKN